MIRSMTVGALSLIALQVFLSGKGPDAGGAMLGWLHTGLQKAISPKVAAIPRAKSSKAAAKPSTSGTVTALPRNPTVSV